MTASSQWFGQRTCAGVAAWDGGADFRVGASSMGLQAVRVAAAAAKLARRQALNARDAAALAAVSSKLTREARILTGEAPLESSDESSYAFAEATLSASPRESDDVSKDQAAARLKELAQTLDGMRSPSGKDVPTEDLESIEKLFLRVTEVARESLSRPGEILDGKREQMTGLARAS